MRQTDSEATPSGNGEEIDGAFVTGTDTGKYLISVIQDISKRSAEIALRDSEERFRQLAENIHQVFWIRSAQDDGLLYVSPAYETIFGRSCQSLYDRPWSWIEAVHPEDRQQVLESLKTANITSENNSIEYRILRPDGKQVWIGARTVPIFNEAGVVYRWAGIAENITERKQAEAETLKALGRERELNELKSRFVAIVSHEFRTPLSTILSSADLLEYYIQKWPHQKNEQKIEHLWRIQTSVINMTQLLEDVLFIGRAESGKLPFSPERIELTSFCGELVEEIQSCTLKRHSLIYAKPEHTVTAVLDGKLLRQILNNLLLNAIKYSPEGGAIYFEFSANETEATFKIQDNGIGIPPEDLPRLFEPFHRGQNVGALPGTGLGLTVVKQCVELQGGRVSVESQINRGVGSRGTTFTVSLPLHGFTV